MSDDSQEDHGRVFTIDYYENVRDEIMARIKDYYESISILQVRMTRLENRRMEYLRRRRVQESPRLTGSRHEYGAEESEVKTRHETCKDITRRERGAVGTYPKYGGGGINAVKQNYVRGIAQIETEGASSGDTMGVSKRRRSEEADEPPKKSAKLDKCIEPFNGNYFAQFDCVGDLEKFEELELLQTLPWNYVDHTRFNANVISPEAIRECTVLIKDVDPLVGLADMLKEFMTMGGLLPKFHTGVLAIVPWSADGNYHGGQIWMLWSNNRLTRYLKQMYYGKTNGCVFGNYGPSGSWNNDDGISQYSKIRVLIGQEPFRFRRSTGATFGHHYAKAMWRLAGYDVS